MFPEHILTVRRPWNRLTRKSSTAGTTRFASEAALRSALQGSEMKKLSLVEKDRRVKSRPGRDATGARRDRGRCDGSRLLG